MPVFHYDPYRNPYGPSIAEALARQADPQAAAALRSGDIEARAAQQQGALRAQMWSEVGAIPGAIQAQQGARRQAAAQEQQLQIGGLQLDAAQREARSRNLFEAESQNPANQRADGTIDEDKFLAALRRQDVGAYQKAVALKQANQQASLAWTKGIADLAASSATADEKRAQALKLRQEYLGTQALAAYTGLQQQPDDPLHARDWALGLATTAVADNAVSPGVANQWIRQLAGAGPDQVSAALLSAVPPEMRAKYEKEQAEAGKARAEAVKPIGVAAGGSLVTPPNPDAPTAPPTVLYTAPPPPPKPGEGQHVVNGQLLGPGGERIGAPVPKQVDPTTAGDVTALSPAGLDAAALNYAKTGLLPPLGMGDKTTRKQIINRAAEMMPGLDIASAKADYTANTQSLQAMQKQRDAIGAFDQTAQKNIDLFLAQAGKVVDTGSPLANSLVRQVTGQMLGSPDQAAYEAARQVAVTEIAKIVQGGGIAGVLSDSARHEISAFNPQSATLAQTVRVMRLLKQDMDNRTSALDDAIGGIKSRIKKGAPDAGGAGGAGGVKVLSIVPVP